MARESIEFWIQNKRVEKNEKLVTVEMGNTYLKLRTGLNFKQEIGENAWIGFDWDKAYFFDKKIGKTITGD